MAPMPRGDDQLSGVTRARAQRPAGSTCCPGRIGPRSACPRGRPAVPGHTCLGPKALGVDLLSLETPARLRKPAGSTSSSEGLGPGSEGLSGRLAVPWDSGSCPRARGADQHSLDHRGLVRRPSGMSSCPGPLRPGSKALGVDKLFRATRARVRRPEVSTSVSGRLALVSEGPRVRPVRRGDSGSCQRAHGVDLLSLATGTCLQRPSGST